MDKKGSFLSRMLGFVFTPNAEAVRREQLTRFAHLSAQMSKLHSRNGSREAAWYRDMSDEAQTILAEGFRHEQMKELAMRLPDAPDYMNPKAIDNGLEVEPWQTVATKLHLQLREAALNLRAIDPALTPPPAPDGARNE